MKKRLLSVGLLLLSAAGFSQTFIDEDFEGFTVGQAGPTFSNGWTNTGTTNPRWEVEDASGANENSLATGPFFDASTPTTSGGKYIYLETSGGLLGDENVFSSPTVSIPLTTTSMTFEFAYHMFGASMGELHVVADTNGVSDTIVSFIGQQQTAGADPFLVSSTVLTGYEGTNLTIRFIGVRGSSYTGDISIDEVKLFNPLPNDAGLISIIDPISSTTLSANELIIVDIFNFGSNTITSLPISFIVDGGTPVTETVTTAISPSTSLQYTFNATGDFSAPGLHTIEVYTSLPSDGDLTNDTLRKSVTKFVGITTFPYFENFENGDGQWIAGGTNSSWQYGVPAGSEISSASSGVSAWVTNLTGQYNVNESSFVESQIFDFTSLTAPVFSARVHWTSENSWDGTVLQSSIDGGISWQKIGAFGDPDNWYTDNTINGLISGLEPSGEGWTGDANINGSQGWVTAKQNLTSLAGEPTVKLRFAFGSDGSVTREGFAFDDITVYETPAIDAELLSIIDPNSNCGLGNETVSVAIVNAGLNNISNFPVAIQVNNGTPLVESVTATILPLDTLIYTFTGTVNLTAIGTYSLKAYTGITGDGLNSNDTLLKSVVSIPTTSVFPYTESFETGNGGWISSGTANSWALGAPAGSVIDTAFSGTQAWVTNLTGNHNNNEASFVTSSCFDFTSLTTPIIAFNIWYDASTSNDGALLQASVDGGNTWFTVGAVGDPNNWYNDNTIFGLNAIDPNQQGWTGSGTAGSNGWIAARRSLPLLGGEPSVRFRFAFGSDGFTQTDGFAFDNVSIFETPSSDAGLVEIVDPTSGCGLSAAEPVTVRVVNDGAVNLTSTPVYLEVNGMLMLSDTIAAVILPGDTLSYTFNGTIDISTVGNYSLKAYTSLSTDALPVNDTTVKNIVNIPIFSGFPYFESFESGNGGWTSGGSNSSWALGTPTNTIINSASNGTQAWVTNLTGLYTANESSFVVSPCFDFTTLTLPVISMDIWWNSEFSWDGAALQSSVDGGTTWQKVGAFGDPNNWYTDNTINGLISGLEPSGEGWTGRNSSTNGSNGWVKAQATLSGLGNVSGVLLRVAFGSDGSVQDEGFAFDNIQVYDTPAQDAGIVSIESPSNGCALTSAEQVEVLIVNAGTSSISNFDVSIQVNGGTPITETISTTILSLDTLFYTFTGTVNLGTPGNYSLKAYTTLTGDPLPSNDTSLKTVVNIPVITSYPYSEGFENGNAGWIAGGQNSSWALGTPAGTVINSASQGTASWATNLTGDANISEESFVQSTCFDFTNLVSPIVSFDIWWESDNSNDGAALQSSIDGGATWQKVGDFGDPDNWYNDNTIFGLVNIEPSQQGWTGRLGTGSGGWVTAKHKLDGLGGISGVLLRVVYGANTFTTSEGFAFDNFEIFESPAIDIKVVEISRPLVGCGLGASEIIGLTLENQGTDTLSNFPLVYSINGTPINVPETFTDTLLPNATMRFEFATTANMSALTTFNIEAYASITGDFDNSNDTASLSLTNIAAETTPYTVDFDVLTDGATDFSPIKWTAINAGLYNWRAESTTTSSTATGPSGTRSGLGTYVYTEASSGTVGDTIFLESTCVDLTPTSGTNASTSLEYWYHMYGADIVALGLQIDSAGIWTEIDRIVGQQQTANADTFRLRTIDLSAYQGLGVSSFRFWSIKGASFNGDVAIDDFRIYDTVGVNVAMDSIISPVTNCGLGANADVIVSISNRGLSNVSNFPVTYILNNGTPVTETVTSTINPGNSLNYTFTTTVNLQTVGNYSLTVYATVPGDGDVTNDTASSSITSGFAQVLDNNNPFYANAFEQTTNNWVTYGTNNSWEIGTPSTFFLNRPFNGVNAYVTSAASTHNANEMSYIETPCFDLSFFNASDIFELEFQILYQSEIGEDQLWMEMTTDNGSTWNKVLPDVASFNFYNNTTDNVWEGFSSGGVGNYLPVLNSVTGIGGLSQVKFRFAFMSNGTLQNEGFAIDEFIVGTPLYTGIGANAINAADFSLFPNPTKDLVTIGFDNVQEGQYNLSIVDVKGQEVNNELFNVTSNNTKKVIDLSSVERGVYFVRIVSGETSVTKKLIVR